MNQTVMTDRRNDPPPRWRQQKQSCLIGCRDLLLTVAVGIALAGACTYAGHRMNESEVREIKTLDGLRLR